MKMMMNKQTILWADDDVDDLLLMREILREKNHNFNITEVYNGKEALDFLKNATEADKLPCLIILDINMPVLNGKETLVRIKASEAFAKIPVVMFTTSNSPMDKIFCEKYGVEMITKPPQYETLSRIIQKLLALCQ